MQSRPILQSIGRAVRTRLNASRYSSCPNLKTVSNQNVKKTESTFVSYKPTEDDRDFRAIERTEIRGPMDPPTKRNTIENLIENVNNHKCISSLLNTVQPHLNDLKPEHLSAIYFKINSMYFELNAELVKHKYHRHIIDFLKIIDGSSTFGGLLDRALSMSDKLSNDCLLNVFDTFSWTNVRDEKRAFQIILTNIYLRLNELTLDDLISFLNALNVYNRNRSSNGLLSSFSKVFMKIAKNKIIQNDFHTKDVQVLGRCFTVFLLNLDYEVADHLTRLLLSPDCELNVRESANLLNTIQVAKKRTLKEFGSEFERDLNKLIEKCNSSIIDQMTANPSIDDAVYYLSKLDFQRKRLEKMLRNLYDPKLLNVLSRTLIEHSREDPNYSIFYLLHNYSKVNIFNENLIEFAYALACNDDKFRLHAGIGLFLIVSKFRFPFVDCQRLMKQLFDQKTDQIQKAIAVDAYTAVNLVSNLILNDIDDERFLKYFEQFVNMEITYFRLIRLEGFRKLILARAYFSVFTKMRGETKIKIENGFKNLFAKMSTIKHLSIQNNCLHSDRLLEGGSLSNGVHISPVVIYDRSTQDLISLVDFKDYFHRLEQAPLNANQELLTFLDLVWLEGTAKQYERNSVYRLRMLLNHFNIKTIDVPKGYVKLSTEKRKDYVIKKALNFYGH